MDAGAAAAPDLWPQLIAAATQGNSAQVGALLDQGADIEARDATQGASALHFACERGHREVVALLLSRGANTEALSTLGSTPIISASCNGHLEVIELLHSRGANIHHANANGINVLHQAAWFDRLPVCEFLLSKGVDLMAADNQGWTATSHYGYHADTSLAPEIKVLRRTALHTAHIAYWRGVQAADGSTLEALHSKNNRLSAVKHNYASLLFSGTFSDLVFVCPGGERIHAHRCIVAMCSPHMSALLQGPWAENAGGQVSEVAMPQSAVAVRALLRFMYTGEVDAAACTYHTMDVLDLASQHEQPYLKAACATLIGDAISATTLLPSFKIALMYDFAALKAKCITFVQQDITDLSLPELIQLADEHGVPELRDTCDRGSAALLRVDNVVSYLEVALNFDLKLLKFRSFALVQKHMDRLSLPELIELANKHNSAELKAACEYGTAAILSRDNVNSYIEAAVQLDLPLLKAKSYAFVARNVARLRLSDLVQSAAWKSVPELRAAYERGAIESLCLGNFESYLTTALDLKLDALKDACFAFVQKNMSDLRFSDLVQSAAWKSIPELKAACERGCIAILCAKNVMSYLETALLLGMPLLQTACVALVEKGLSPRTAEASLNSLVRFAEEHGVPELRAVGERGAIAALCGANVMSLLVLSVGHDLPTLKQGCVDFVEKNVALLSLENFVRNADRCRIPELKAACEKGCIANLGYNNAVSLLDSALQHGMPLLKTECVAFVAKHIFDFNQAELIKFKNVAHLRLSDLVQSAAWKSVPELRAACERGCIANLGYDNAVSFLDTALQHDMPELKTACIAFIKSSAVLAVSPAFLELAAKHPRLVGELQVAASVA